MDSTHRAPKASHATPPPPVRRTPNVRAAPKPWLQKHCRKAVALQKWWCIAARQGARRREAIDELRGRRLNLQFAAAPGQTVELLRLGSTGTLRLVPVKGGSVGFSLIGNDRSTCKSVSA